MLSEIAQGKSNAAVAASLYLSVRAVEKHINSLFAKLGLTGQTDLHRRVKAVLLYLSESGVDTAGGGSTTLTITGSHPGAPDQDVQRWWVR